MQYKTFHGNEETEKMRDQFTQHLLKQGSTNENSFELALIFKISHLDYKTRQSVCTSNVKTLNF